jgi:plastocyanin
VVGDVPRRTGTALAAALAGLALAATGAADAATYHGYVGPGKTIKLLKGNGTRVTSVRAGRHTFVIHDSSKTHNFVLARGGTKLRATGVAATGVFQWRGVRLRAGTYTYYCATHKRAMRGSFRVR